MSKPEDMLCTAVNENTSEWTWHVRYIWILMSNRPLLCRDSTRLTLRYEEDTNKKPFLSEVRRVEQLLELSLNGLSMHIHRQAHIHTVWVWHMQKYIKNMYILQPASSFLSALHTLALVYIYIGSATQNREPCFPRGSGKNEHMQLGKGWVEEKSKREGKKKKTDAYCKAGQWTWAETRLNERNRLDLTGSNHKDFNVQQHEQHFKSYWRVP